MVLEDERRSGNAKEEESFLRDNDREQAWALQHRGSSIRVMTRVYLTLGDADFSYSYDLARHLLASQQQTQQQQRHAVPTAYRLIATGWDSQADLLAKYKDASFFLQQLQKLNTAGGRRRRQSQQQQQQQGRNANGSNNDKQEPLFAVEIHHGVNAIVRPPLWQDDLKNDKNNNKNNRDTHHSLMFPSLAHVLIFNHPHVGTEDAVLHARFLSHLLYSAARYWLVSPPPPSSSGTTSSSAPNKKDDDDDDDDNRHYDGGVFYLTLVQGQWERWKGSQAAAKHGWHLVHVSPLVGPPPTANAKGSSSSSYYQVRRHQTGKSFAIRKQTSWVYCLVRRTDDDNEEKVATTSALQSMVPPYPHGEASSPPRDDDDDDEKTTRTVSTTTTTSFTCEYCDKQFAQERSLRNHVRCKHSPNNGRDAHHRGTEAARPPTQSRWTCTQCATAESPHRRRRGVVFESQRALQHHILAKHQVVHADVRPDWSMAKKTQPQQTDQQSKVESPTVAIRPVMSHGGSCPICDCPYYGDDDDDDDEERHWNSFAPPPDDARYLRSCSFCHKRFREERALRQHENFCAHRQQAKENE